MWYGTGAFHYIRNRPSLLNLCHTYKDVSVREMLKRQHGFLFCVLIMKSWGVLCWCYVRTIAGHSRMFIMWSTCLCVKKKLFLESGPIIMMRQPRTILSVFQWHRLCYDDKYWPVQWVQAKTASTFQLKVGSYFIYVCICVFSVTWMAGLVTTCHSRSWKIPSPYPRSLERVTYVPATTPPASTSCASPTPASRWTWGTCTASAEHFFHQNPR